MKFFYLIYINKKILSRNFSFWLPLEFIYHDAPGAFLNLFCSNSNFKHFGVFTGAKGLEIPVDYKLISENPYYLQKLLRKLSKKEFTKDFNLSRIPELKDFEILNRVLNTAFIWVF